MNYLITGLTGFAGPHLARLLLKEGHEVYGIIRGSNGRQNDLLDILTPEEISSIHWKYCDLNDYCSVQSILSEKQFDGIFHLAAQSHPPTSFLQPIETFKSNVMGSLNLITCVEKYQEKCRFQFCSTSEVYGDVCKDCGILKIDTPLQPANPYGASKAAIDLYMQERIKNKKIDGYITRAFSHTGPRRGFNFSISSDAYQIAKMMSGVQDKVLLIGNLKTKRIVIDVRDCVRAYYLLMMNPNCSGPYNICGKEVYEMQHFTDILIDQSELKDIEQRIHKPFYREIDIQIQIGDTTKLQKDIDWSPEIPIEKTLEDLLNYWIQKLKYIV